MAGTKNNPYALHMSNLYAGGLVAVDLVFLQAVLPAGVAQLEMRIAMLGYAIALPLLAGILIINNIEEWFPFLPPQTQAPRFVHALFFLGTLTDLVALCATFWSAAWYVGLAFAITFALAMAIYGWYITQLRKKP